jgi:hypothetical protein
LTKGVLLFEETVEGGGPVKGKPGGREEEGSISMDILLPLAAERLVAKPCKEAPWTGLEVEPPMRRLRTMRGAICSRADSRNCLEIPGGSSNPSGRTKLLLGGGGIPEVPFGVPLGALAGRGERGRGVRVKSIKGPELGAVVEEAFQAVCASLCVPILGMSGGGRGARDMFVGGGCG